MPAFSVKQDLSWEEALMALKLDESCDVKTSVDLSSPSRLSFSSSLASIFIREYVYETSGPRKWL